MIVPEVEVTATALIFSTWIFFLLPQPMQGSTCNKHPTTAQEIVLRANYRLKQILLPLLRVADQLHSIILLLLLCTYIDPYKICFTHCLAGLTNSPELFSCCFPLFIKFPDQSLHPIRWPPNFPATLLLDEPRHPALHCKAWRRQSRKPDQIHFLSLLHFL